MKLRALLLFVRFSLFLSLVIGVPAQTITDFTPKFASPGEMVSITGSGFSLGAITVRFWNGRVASATPTTDSQIFATVPSGVSVGPISVQLNSQTPVFSTENFTPIGPGPYVSGFAPFVGTAGTTNIIAGAHFTGVTAVKFNGINSPFFYPTEDTSILARVPANVTTGPITVTTPLGTFTTSSNFFVPPVVSGFSPVNGRPGTNVLILGTNFLGTTSVRFAGTPASFTVLSNNAIQASVPVGAVTGMIQIFAPAGSFPTSSNFVVQPTLFGFNPGFGPAGTVVTIQGANFNVGSPEVRFNGILAAPPSGVSFNQLTAVVPAGATTGPISVTTSNGTASSEANFFLPAIITSFAPSNSPPGTLVTVRGTNFTGVTAVTFNGTPAAGFFPTNNNSLGALVPLGVTTGPVGITTPAGTVASTAKFYGAPLITGFDPTHGLPGTNVTIFGQNFTDALFVRFNGSNASFSVVNNTTLSATVPNNAQTGPLTVGAPAGTTNSAQDFVLDYTANLSLSVNDSPDPAVVGSNIIYVITVVNNGPFAAPSVNLTDTLIGAALLKAATTSQGTLSTNTAPITGVLGTINVGESAIVTLTVAAQSEGMITNIATVASQYPDPNPTNNSLTNTTYVQPLPLLNVQRVGTDRVRLSWPAALTNYGLQFKPVLEAAPPWSSITTLPSIVGSEYQLTETNGETMRFYRLQRLP